MALEQFSRSGQVLSQGDALTNFLKVFSGEVLTAFTRASYMTPLHMIRQIQHGKSATFPIMGRAKAKYLQVGDSLDDQRKSIDHNQREIAIDGLLTSDVLISDLDDAMNHYDVRVEYSKQLGEALAIGADCGVLNELINLAKGAENIPTKDGVLGTGKATNIVTGAEVSQDASFGEMILEGLAEARAKFTEKYVPTSDRYFVCPPDVYSAILNALMPSTANYQALIDPVTGHLKQVMGFEVIEIPHFTNEGVDGKHTVDGSILTAGAQGVAFHRSAVGTVKLKDLAMEHARRPEYQADQIIAKYAMGHGGLRPEAVSLFTKTALA